MTRRAGRISAALFGVISLIASACSPAPDSSYREVSVSDVKEILTEKPRDYRLIDVRTPREFDAGHIEGAENIDVQASSFRQIISEIPRDEAVIVYCRSGNRSAKAVGIMQELGFENISEMKDGWLGWSSEQVETE